MNIQGQISTGALNGPHGGFISVIAGGSLSWPSGGASASAARGGSILLQSLGSDVVVSGSFLARAESALLDAGGSITVQAAGGIDFTGTLDASTAQSFTTAAGIGPQVSLVAGHTLRIHTGSVIQIQSTWLLCETIGGPVLLDGCRVIVESGASVSTCAGYNAAGGSAAYVNVIARDVLTVDGTISAGVAGQVLVTSRLASQYAIAGSGTITPPPVVTVDPTLLPCLAQSTTIAATSPVTAGQPITIAVTSHPLRPLLIAADLTLAHLPLGLYGWTQVNVLTGYLVADGLGILGTPIPGATDASGQWSWSIVTPVTPVLSNVDVYFDLYVIDPTSLNGLFEQPPYATIHFN